MSFIKNMFGNKDTKAKMKESGYSKNYIDLLSNSIGVMRLRQKRFAEVIAGLDWNVDLTHGVIEFGDRRYPIQFIGSESHVSNTWMWGSNNVNGFRDEIVKSVRIFVERSEIKNTKEICENGFKMDSMINGHYLASIFADYANACYYRCNYENGAAFVLVKDVPEEVYVSADAEVVMSTITELISQLPLNHLLLVKGLFKHNCIRYDNMSNEVLKGYFRDAKMVEISFDGMERITNMKLGKY